MDILNEILSPYWPAIWKSLICCLAVLIAIGLDLISGIRKSKAAGIKVTHTYGLDRTLDKLRKRFNLLFIFITMDLVLIACDIHTTMIPYATVAITIIFCIVEAKSIGEKDKDKGRYIEAAKTAAEMWKGIDKEEIADVIIKKLDEKRNEKNN
ncbi:hypothetical protein D0T84_19400 [Dysgonomonas sp. 521]|uniref:hypothetical protein n=1 Tax=Dysgonomonas sp. 521 TaxID=2302932 RepID=UPI0013D33F10|nr:hypothetical protein [Dysgonomonas sp. 521]NDV97055.1 hypothetical protein [Dysgonomonas sp. 521]